MIRAVADTNVLVSAAIKPRGEAGRVLAHWQNGEFTLLYGTALLEELIDVLNRPHLRDKYRLTPHYLHLFLGVIRIRGEKVEPTHRVTVCRDPHDDMFMDVALNGEADYVISNDNDLLVLSPFEDIQIITPSAFLRQLEHQNR